MNARREKGTYYWKMNRFRGTVEKSSARVGYVFAHFGDVVATHIFSDSPEGRSDRFDTLSNIFHIQSYPFNNNKL